MKLPWDWIVKVKCSHLPTWNFLELSDFATWRFSAWLLVVLEDYTPHPEAQDPVILWTWNLHQSCFLKNNDNQLVNSLVTWSVCIFKTRDKKHFSKKIWCIRETFCQNTKKHSYKKSLMGRGKCTSLPIPSCIKTCFNNSFLLKSHVFKTSVKSLWKTCFTTTSSFYREGISLPSIPTRL